MRRVEDLTWEGFSKVVICVTGVIDGHDSFFMQCAQSHAVLACLISVESECEARYQRMPNSLWCSVV